MKKTVAVAFAAVVDLVLVASQVFARPLVLRINVIVCAGDNPSYIAVKEMITFILKL